MPASDTDKTVHTTEKNLCPEKENTTDIIFHHWPLSPAGFHLKTLQLSPVNVTGHSLSKANVLLGYHRHSASEASTHTVTQKTGGHKYILRETPSCRRAAPRAHTQYILIKELSLGPENYWILMHLKLIQPAQTQTWGKLCYYSHYMIPILMLKDHFHIILRYKVSLSKSTKMPLTSFLNSFLKTYLHILYFLKKPKNVP